MKKKINHIKRFFKKNKGIKNNQRVNKYFQFDN